MVLTTVSVLPVTGLKQMNIAHKKPDFS